MIVRHATASDIKSGVVHSFWIILDGQVNTFRKR